MTDKKGVAIPRKASTVILLRERKEKGIEVFLLKRHENNAFMGGNFVYPGGRVDREDGSLEILPYCKEISTRQGRETPDDALTDQENIAYRIAGIRELFEEAGILLAYGKDGLLLSLRGEERESRFHGYRRMLQNREITLASVAKSENLLLALDQLYYYAHWITPEARNIRFDTRFFLALAPAGQEPSYDGKETTEGFWLTPVEALEGNIKGTIALSPPTLKTLEDLSRFDAIAHMLSSLQERQKPAVLPLLVNPLADEVLVFPWDPDYEALKGGLAYPTEHGEVSDPHDRTVHTTRLVLKNGRYLPYVK